MNGRRSNIQIIAEILKLGEDGASKTQIRNSIDLRHYQLQKYIGFLLAHGFIGRLAPENCRFTYRLTEKGSMLLKSINNVLEALGFEDK